VLGWSEALLALLLSHVVGDVLFQTDLQARTKDKGLATQVGRRGLTLHVLTYMVAFVPALVWLAFETGVARALLVAALVAVTHFVVDDGRLVRGWLRTVKGVARPPVALSIAVDQSFHVLCLLGAALVATA
jgi:Protein of unknown function (DUF3307)